MSRRLFFLNLLLVALLGAAGWQMCERYREARLREQALLSQRVQVKPAPEAPKIEPVAPVTAATYADVATKMLFARDRNPNVVIEAPKEEPVPAFPQAFGVMDLGNGATVFMAEKPGGPQKGYRSGDTVGPFKLTSVTRETLMLEWKDKKFEKKVADLKPKETVAAAAAVAAGVSGSPTPVPGANETVLDGRIVPIRTANSEENLKKAQESLIQGGVVNTGGNTRVCAPGDSTPAGAVVNGYRKVTRQGMFGQVCYWEPAR